MASMAADVPTAAEAIQPKQEPLLDGYTSSSMSSPEPEHEPSTRENPAPPVKRKGGRKPVRSLMSPVWFHAHCNTRYMLPQRSESREIVKLKPLFESDEQNTSSSSKQQSKDTKRRYNHCNRATEMQQTNASCFATRILYLNESSSRKVGARFPTRDCH